MEGSGARWLVTTAGLYAQKLAAAAAAAQVVQTFVIGGMTQPHQNATAFDALAAGPDGEPTLAHATEPSAVAFLPTSSGTTGLPKHVMLTHRSLVAGVSQLRLGHPVRQDDVVLVALPVFHVSGFETTALALLEGATVVLLPGFELDPFLAAIQNHRVTRAEVVPPIVRLLADDKRVADYHLSSLRVLGSLAAPLGG